MSLTEDDFPEDGRNIVSISLFVEVLDNDEDNEELSGLVALGWSGCSRFDIRGMLLPHKILHSSEYIFESRCF